MRGALLALGAVACSVGARGNHDPWSTVPVGDTSLTDATPVEYLDPAELPAGDAPCREPLLVEVTEGVDGDTLWAEPVTGGPEELVRLIGFDTPEIAWDGGTSDCWAEEAQARTRALIEGEHVWLTFDEECVGPYDRTLAYVHTGLEVSDFFNVEMVRDGYGKVMTIPPNDTFADLFHDAEDEAQASSLGVWSCGS